MVGMARRRRLPPLRQSHQHAGVRSRLAGIGGQKTKRTQARLGTFAFFESHIRATNAPALRNLNFLNYVKKLCLLAGALTC